MYCIYMCVCLCVCVCVCFIVCIVSVNKCVWSPVSLYFSVGSLCVQYTQQTAEQTQPRFAPETTLFNLILHNMFTLLLKLTSTWELHDCVFV